MKHYLAPPSAASRIVSGRDLARARTKKQRIGVALAIADAGGRIDGLSKGQIAKLCGCSTSTVAHGRKAGAPTLAERLANVSHAELADIGHQLGAEWLWMNLVEPVLAL